MSSHESIAREPLDVGGLSADWRHEWELAGRPDHDCDDERIDMTGGSICGACGLPLDDGEAE
jgi:hypothetical protein